MKLFIWDNSIIVVADSLASARASVVKRLAEMDSAIKLVMQEEPLEYDLPCVHVIYTARSIS